MRVPSSRWVIAGQALPNELPDPKVVLFFAQAVRFTSPLVLPGLTISEKDVFFAFDVRNQTNTRYDGVQACAAVYDQKGNVVFVDSSEVLSETSSGTIVPASLDPQELTSVFWGAENVPAGPVQVRAWLWFGPKGAPTSQYQFAASQMMTIQSMHP